jgi:hypothetical protein
LMLIKRGKALGGEGENQRDAQAAISHAMPGQ